MASVREDPSDNTPLHDAILAGDKDLALALIKADKSEHPTDIESELKNLNLPINKKSMGNTPLMLALKTGNLEIAEALLDHPGVLCYLTDSKGLAPLHWACMLRADTIISKLIEKNMHIGIDPIEKWWLTSELRLPYSQIPEKYKLTDQTPFSLYLNDISLSWMLHHVEHGAFHDHPKLVITRSESYTDMIFHMDKLCQNLPWMKEHKLSFETLGHNLMQVSEVVFKHNFQIAIKDFVNERNKIKPKMELLEELFKPLEGSSLSQAVFNKLKTDLNTYRASMKDSKEAATVSAEIPKVGSLGVFSASVSKSGAEPGATPLEDPSTKKKSRG